MSLTNIPESRLKVYSEYLIKFMKDGKLIGRYENYINECYKHFEGKSDRWKYYDELMVYLISKIDPFDYKQDKHIWHYFREYLENNYDPKKVQRWFTFREIKEYTKDLNMYFTFMAEQEFTTKNRIALQVLAIRNLCEVSTMGAKQLFAKNYSKENKNCIVGVVLCQLFDFKTIIIKIKNTVLFMEDITYILHKFVSKAEYVKFVDEKKFEIKDMTFYPFNNMFKESSDYYFNHDILFYQNTKVIKENIYKKGQNVISVKFKQNSYAYISIFSLGKDDDYVILLQSPGIILI